MLSICETPSTTEKPSAIAGGFFVTVLQLLQRFERYTPLRTYRAWFSRRFPRLGEGANHCAVGVFAGASLRMVKRPSAPAYAHPPVSAPEMGPRYSFL